MQFPDVFIVLPRFSSVLTMCSAVADEKVAEKEEKNRCELCSVATLGRYSGQKGVY